MVAHIFKGDTIQIEIEVGNACVHWVFPCGMDITPARRRRRDITLGSVGTMKDIEGLSGINAAMTAALAERFLENPDEVGEPWRGVFEAMGPEALSLLAGTEAVMVWQARRRARQNGHAPAAAGAEGAAAGWRAADELRLEWAVRDLIDAYRRDGHLHADLNPLEPAARGVHLDLGAFGLTPADMGRALTRCDVPMRAGATVGELIGALEATWCGSIGAEVAFVEDREARRWLIGRLEGCRNREPFDRAGRLGVLKSLNEATLLEQFVHRKFVGVKRFSLEGGESLIPMLHRLVDAAGNGGVEDIVLGMAHRGRLNVMVNVLGKEPEELFAKFHDVDALSNLGGGDVKYHHGQSRDVVTSGGERVHLSLCFNPSHLEFVNPVVLGRARAKQDRLGDAEGRRVMPVLIHGDSAIVGQGIVAESLNMAQLDGYSSGGAVHIVINNQIGFTTDPRESRFTRYATDIARWIGAPVLHVNGDDPEAAVHAAQVAFEWRQRTRSDIFIDLICYRRHGHNEGDEPRFTQPEMYSAIDGHAPIREIYAGQLVAEGVLSAAEDAAMIEAWTEVAEAALQASLERKVRASVESLNGVWKGYRGGADGETPQVDTGVERERLSRLLAALCEPPEGFEISGKLRRFMSGRREMAAGERPLDWGAAEALAFATLVDEGFCVRLSGQDGQRGTFSHRHAVLSDARSGKRWAPIKGVCQGGATFTVWNSPLSESSVMGFDWGYSLDRPEGLTIWEAQFGDFANGAQVIIDQFLASSEDKWDRLSGLTLLLPHGYAGQGPEHSSARLERFMLLCAEDNMQVCNPTTPAQLFHLLRRQVLRPIRKPLIVMSPKGLLRLKEATSDLEALTAGRFQHILPDDLGLGPKEVERVLLCSGQLYYDLMSRRSSLGAQGVAIVRFEQLYPLSAEVILEALGGYKGVPCYWVQEEPWNMGAWLFIQASIREVMGVDFPLQVISRAASASPATGSKASHDFESERLLDVAFGVRQVDETGSVRLHKV